jgi:FdhE protein
MKKAGTPRYDPVPIGEVARPPFARPPDPLSLFRSRAQRFVALAARHELAEYLRFLAGLAETQHRIQEELPVPDPPSEELRAGARELSLPSLPRDRFTFEPVFAATLARLLAYVTAVDMPPPARVALQRLTNADIATREHMVRAVLANSLPIETLAEHVYVAAALQVHFARLAAQLNPDRLVPIGKAGCPVCGGLPVCSLVVGWRTAQATRFCACALCGTLWNYVRIKCTLCGSTKSISYQQIEGGSGTVKAETCGTCHGYVKILHQHEDPQLEPVADDVATLGLDLLLREAGYRRGGVNFFLHGY